MAGFSRRKALSSLAASAAAAAAGLVHYGGSGTPTAAADDMPSMAGMSGMEHGTADTAGHSGHAGFARGGAVDNAANGFDPSLIVRDFDGGTVSQLGRRAHAARVAADRGATRRSRSPPACKFAAWTFNGRVPGPTLRCTRGRPAAHPLHERQLAPAHDALPRHPPLAHGRRAGTRRGHRRRADRAGPVVHLRVRRRAVRAAPLPLPRDAARRAHRQGPLRHVHRRPEGAARRRPTSS